jgi:hypothetical protein
LNMLVSPMGANLMPGLPCFLTGGTKLEISNVDGLMVIEILDCSVLNPTFGKSWVI